MEKVKTFFKNISSSYINFISFTFSSLAFIRFLRNTHLSSEFRGHFNSPQNIQNMRMRKFYYKDGAVLIIFTFTFTWIGLTSIKFLLSDKKEPEYNEAKDLIEKFNINKDKSGFKDINNKNKEFFSNEFSDLNNTSKDKFNNDKELKNRDRVNEYLNKR